MADDRSLDAQSSFSRDGPSVAGDLQNNGPVFVVTLQDGCNFPPPLLDLQPDRQPDQRSDHGSAHPSLPITISSDSTPAEQQPSLQPPALLPSGQPLDPAAPVDVPQEPSSPVSTLLRAWSLLSLYVPDQLVPRAPSADSFPIFGFPQCTEETVSRPLARQQTFAWDTFMRQVTDSRVAQDSTLLSLQPFKRTLNLLTPSQSNLELYRVKHSGLAELSMPNRPFQLPVAAFREFMRRASHTSDVSNFVALLSAALHTLSSRAVLTDVEQGHLADLSAALCIVSRDFSALAVASEIDFQRLRQRHVLESSTLDRQVRSSLLALPLDNLSLFPGQAARSVVDTYAASAPGVIAALSRPRPRPYSRPARQAPSSSTRRQPSATITSQSHFQVPAPPQPRQQARGSRQASHPFRGGRRGRRQ